MTTLRELLVEAYTEGFEDAQDAGPLGFLAESAVQGVLGNHDLTLDPDTEIEEQP
jgi:hypothetical protein